VARDVKIKYRKSVLGVLWTILNPLLMMTILSIVFSNLFKFDVENYALYILAGQIIFGFYSEATSASMTAILGNASLIKKVYIPKYLFVFSRIISGSINILSSVCALIIVMIFTRAQLHLTMFLCIIPLILVIVLVTGVGLLLAAVTARFRDILHLYSIFVTALLYLTPVIYPISILPHWVRVIVNINPLTGILNIFRDLVIYNTIPELKAFLVSSAIVLLFLAVGIIAFFKRQDKFILEV
jgi:ABC-2 type transport system permease protein